MEPRIQYAKTSDGVSIAYWTMGEGNPLVHLTSVPASHIEAEMQFPEFRAWYEHMARKRMLVRYDVRGAGLSDREITGISLDAFVRDLEAVVDHLGLQSFALFAPGPAGSTAIAYATRHPHRVSHLILWLSSARPSVALRGSRVQALMALLDTDWELFTETVAHTLQGWSAGEPARRVAALFRQSVTPDFMRAAFQALEDFDVADLLPSVRSPTLVLHRRDYPHVDVGNARSLSAGIPNAELTILDGSAFGWFLQDWESVADAIDEFLSEGAEPETKAELPEGMAVILFADIVESTALTEQLGDAAFREKARELDSSLRSLIRKCSGTPVEGKLVGDGVLAVFTSARQAIDCALRCNAASEPIGLQLHLGVHAGDVIREGNNVYGGAVNIAARIASASAPGEVLVSDTVRGLARTSAGVSFDDRGEHTLKGIADPQRLFAVRGGG